MTTTYRKNISKKAMIDAMIAEGYITEAERILVNRRLKEEVMRCFNNMLWWKDQLNKTNFFIIQCRRNDGVWEYIHNQDIRAHSVEEAMTEVRAWCTGYTEYECVYVEDYDYRATHF